MALSNTGANSELKLRCEGCTVYCGNRLNAFLAMRCARGSWFTMAFLISLSVVEL